MTTLAAFSPDEIRATKLHLATQVAFMMGRKLEEGDWTGVYCRGKGIPETGWSNLHIDVNFQGLGVEHKLLRCGLLNGRPIKTICGTTLMHPAATRSIRIEDVSRDANDVMRDVFEQYAELIEARTQAVRQRAGGSKADMRVGWLLWEDTLSEFLYFEERMLAPDPNRYYAEWNSTEARGVRKSSKSLWIFEKATNHKRYSVTTAAGIKIQPYFDVPAPSDRNLYYFRVQSEPVDPQTIQIWVSASTAQSLKKVIGSLSREKVSEIVLRLQGQWANSPPAPDETSALAVPIPMSLEAHAAFTAMWAEAVSDEHRAQLLVKALS